MTLKRTTTLELCTVQAQTLGWTQYLFHLKKWNVCQAEVINTAWEEYNISLWIPWHVCTELLIELRQPTRCWGKGHLYNKELWQHTWGWLIQEEGLFSTQFKGLWSKVEHFHLFVIWLWSSQWPNACERDQTGRLQKLTGSLKNTLVLSTLPISPSPSVSSIFWEVLTCGRSPVWAIQKPDTSHCSRRA